MNKKKFYAEFGVDEETVNPNKPGKKENTLFMLQAV